MDYISSITNFLKPRKVVIIMYSLFVCIFIAGCGGDSSADETTTTNPTTTDDETTTTNPTTTDDNSSDDDDRLIIKEVTPPDDPLAVLVYDSEISGDVDASLDDAMQDATDLENNTTSTNLAGSTSATGGSISDRPTD